MIGKFVSETFHLRLCVQDSGLAIIDIMGLSV